MKQLIALAALLALSACGSNYKLVDSDRRAIGKAYSVEPQITWSTFSVTVPAGDEMKERNVTTGNQYQIWTVDGTKLQALYLYQGLGEGAALFPGQGLEKQEFPTFRSDMRAPEIVEFVEDSIGRLGNTQVTAQNLRPAAFGSLPGFRFELTYLSPTGLERESTALGVVNAGVLYLILYDGASHYYYPKYRDQVERIFSSIQVI